MRPDPLPWLPLPIEGAPLESCIIKSSGKRGSIELKAVGHPPVLFGMDYSVELVRAEGVRQQFRSLDDVWVELTIEPTVPDVRFLEAKIQYWLDEDPSDFLSEAWNSTRVDMDVCFCCRLAFGTPT